MSAAVTLAEPEHVERDHERDLLRVLGASGDAGGADASADLGDLLDVEAPELGAEPAQALAPAHSRLMNRGRLGTARLILRRSERDDYASSSSSEITEDDVVRDEARTTDAGAPCAGRSRGDRRAPR